MVTSSSIPARLTATERAQRDGIVPLRVGQGRWVCASTSQPGVGYSLAMDDQGRISCSCPGGAGMDCKHRAAVRLSLESERDHVLPQIAGGQDPQACGWGARAVDHAAVATAIPKEQWIERQGKAFVLYAGLLDAAHRAGLVYLAAELVQLGRDDNGLTWICSATARFSDGREFHELGDASPANVSRAMLQNLPRLAATRAKARALRDGVNIGTAAIDELGEDPAAWGAPDAAPANGTAAPRWTRETAPLAAVAIDREPIAPAKPAAELTFEEAFPGQRPEIPLMPRPAELDFPRGEIERLAPLPGVTEPQLRNLRRLGRGRKLDEDALQEACVDRWGTQMEQLSRRDASRWIDELMGAIAGG